LKGYVENVELMGHEQIVVDKELAGCFRFLDLPTVYPEAIYSLIGSGALTAHDVSECERTIISGTRHTTHAPLKEESTLFSGNRL
jgi:hypothetical protein